MKHSTDDEMIRLREALVRIPAESDQFRQKKE